MEADAHDVETHGWSAAWARARPASPTHLQQKPRKLGSQAEALVCVVQLGRLNRLCSPELHRRGRTNQNGQKIQQLQAGGREIC